MHKIRFRQITFVLIYSLIILVILEWVSGKVLKKIDPNDHPRFDFNRQLSGYTVFNNTPNYRYWTYKDGDTGADVRTDNNGFICDEVINLKKDSGTVRIFLMGGSAMLGAGQNGMPQFYMYKAAKNFPGEIYAYRI